MKLDDHVYSFPLTLEMGEREMTINPSGIETEKGLILFDTGIPGSLEKLEQALEEEGFSLEDIHMHVLTHQDMDHAGASKELVEETDAIVVAHENDAPAIRGDEEPVKTRDERYPPVEVDIELAGGETLNTQAGPVKVVSTHGHTPGHVSALVQEKGLLIAGDATVAHDGELTGPREDATPDMEAAEQSIRDICEYDFDSVLCFHGGYVQQGDEELLSTVE